ncbi:hypothetical protein RUND412_002910 [Rhizina undulata]
MAGPMRQLIDVASLEKYISVSVPEIQTPLEVQQFGYGQSNPTYLLISIPTNDKYVLRKKPPGKLISKSAHQVEREYRVIKALEKTDVPAPKVYCLCEDVAIVGTAFYIMEFLDGRIFANPSIPGVSAADRKEMWRSAVTTLAKLHAVSPSAPEVDLTGFGKPNGFYGRQIRTLTMISDAQAKTRDVDTGKEVGQIDKFEQMMEYFKNTQPEDRSTIIHGDYKIDNVVFHPTEPRVIGILDWELSTIGHPLSDLCNLLSSYIFALHPPMGELATALAPRTESNKEFLPGAVEGLPSRDEAIRWYSEAAKWDAGRDFSWGVAFGCLRNSVITQGISARFALRQASSEKAREHAIQTPWISSLAWIYIQKSKEERRRRGEREKSKI